MRKDELAENPIGRQCLWWRVRTNKTPGSSSHKLVAVVVQSLWHKGSSGVDDRYLTVSEYRDPSKRHELHLQALELMPPDMAADYPPPIREKTTRNPILRKELARRLGSRLDISQAQAITWIRQVEEEIALTLAEGNTLILTGFAKFEAVTQAPKKAHHILTSKTEMTNPKPRLRVVGGNVLHKRLAILDRQSSEVS
jgi:nucleoid DNA-binding protein